jgi:ATP-binding protein involved in chromosome partitioning
VPLLLDIRTASDAGRPIAATSPDSEAAKAYDAIARQVGLKVSSKGGARSSGPHIVIN